MNQVKPAAFVFESYKISKFSFAEPPIEQPQLSVSFNPSGTYNQDKGEYTLLFEFITYYGENKEGEMIRAVVEAEFKFNMPMPLDELPSYFYRNSIAIVYPYLRAFVSALTITANVHPLILPVLNLTSLEGELKSNTKIV